MVCAKDVPIVFRRHSFCAVYNLQNIRREQFGLAQNVEPDLILVQKISNFHSVKKPFGIAVSLTHESTVRSACPLPSS
jgi:hypothetical protein